MDLSRSLSRVLAPSASCPSIPDLLFMHHFFPELSPNSHFISCFKKKKFCSEFLIPGMSVCVCFTCFSGFERQAECGVLFPACFEGRIFICGNALRAFLQEPLWTLFLLDTV